MGQVRAEQVADMKKSVLVYSLLQRLPVLWDDPVKSKDSLMYAGSNAPMYRLRSVSARHTVCTCRPAAPPGAWRPAADLASQPSHKTQVEISRREQQYTPARTGHPVC